MGCAQETLEGILGYMHRESVHPSGMYLEEYIESDREGKFQMDNYLDSMGCTPKCAPHHTFGIELLDIVECKKCNNPNQIRNVLPP